MSEYEAYQLTDFLKINNWGLAKKKNFFKVVYTSYKKANKQA